MCKEEYESEYLLEVRSGDAGRLPVGSKVQFEKQELKGIKGLHDIVALDTDSLTFHRSTNTRASLEKQNMNQVAVQRPSKASASSFDFSYQGKGVAT